MFGTPASKWWVAPAASQPPTTIHTVVSSASGRRDDRDGHSCAIRKRLAACRECRVSSTTMAVESARLSFQGGPAHPRAMGGVLRPVGAGRPVSRPPPNTLPAVAPPEQIPPHGAPSKPSAMVTNWCFARWRFRWEPRPPCRYARGHCASCPGAEYGACVIGTAWVETRWADWMQQPLEQARQCLFMQAGLIVAKPVI
jgi:hypothetical protein